MNAIELADSGVEATRPTNANTHENAYPNSSSRPTPNTTSATEAWNEKPMMMPVTTRMQTEMKFVTTSARVRPASTAGRVIGSERKRSIRPLWTSSLRPIAVTKPPNAMFWTMIPGSRNSM